MSRATSSRFAVPVLVLLSSLAVAHTATANNGPHLRLNGNSDTAVEACVQSALDGSCAYKADYFGLVDVAGSCQYGCESCPLACRAYNVQFFGSGYVGIGCQTMRTPIGVSRAAALALGFLVIAWARRRGWRRAGR